MKKILIVDDSAFMREVLKDLLSNTSMPVEVFEAESKPTALDQVKAVEPDLILLDIVMHENEFAGIEILTEVKKRYPDITVVMLTSVGHAEVIEKCKALGITKYIQKPFDRDEVLRCVNMCLT